MPAFLTSVVPPPSHARSRECFEILMINRITSLVTRLSKAIIPRPFRSLKFFTPGSSVIPGASSSPEIFLAKFSSLFALVSVWIWTSNFYYPNLQKKATRSGIMILECSFFFFFNASLHRYPKEPFFKVRVHATTTDTGGFRMLSPPPPPPQKKRFFTRRSFRSAHRDSRIWRPELIESAAECKRRPTFKSAYPDPQILPQCNISSNYPL